MGSPLTLSPLELHARSTPAWAERTLESLVGYLLQPAHNDEEKAYLIFCWIAEHIDYDTESLRTGVITDTSAEAVLARRKTVCDGYANLYCALAARAGLTAAKISGYARGLVLGNSPLGNTHSWNAVLLDGRWQLLDVTWGAGHVEAMQFVREFDAFYFLTPPEQFIYSHIPDDSRWQLLAPPVTRATFEQWPKLKSAFFKYRLHLDSHQCDHLTTNDSVKITLTADAPTELLAQLNSAERELPREYCFTQREGDRYAVKVRFPAPGNYQLMIFARDAADRRNGNFNDVIIYHLTALMGNADSLMPKQYGAFFERNACLYQPWRGRLFVGTQVLFDLTVPGARRVAIIVNGGTWVEMMRLSDDHFQQQIRIAPGTIVIGAQFGTSNSYETLLEYSAR